MACRRSPVSFWPLPDAAVSSLLWAAALLAIGVADGARGGLPFCCSSPVSLGPLPDAKGPVSFRPLPLPPVGVRARTGGPRRVAGPQSPLGRYPTLRSPVFPGPPRCKRRGEARRWGAGARMRAGTHALHPTPVLLACTRSTTHLMGEEGTPDCLRRAPLEEDVRWPSSVVKHNAPRSRLNAVARRGPVRRWSAAGRCPRVRCPPGRSPATRVAPRRR